MVSDMEKNNNYDGNLELSDAEDVFDFEMYTKCILPYYGSITSENLPRPNLLVNTRITLHLYQQLLDRVPTAKEYHMHTDRYYTSIG